MSDQKRVLIDSGTLPTDEKWAVVGSTEPVQPDIEALTDKLIYAAGRYYRKYPADAGASFDMGPQTGHLWDDMRAKEAEILTAFRDQQSTVTECAEHEQQLSRQASEIELFHDAHSELQKVKDTVTERDVTIAKHEQHIKDLRKWMEEAAQELGKVMGYLWYKDDPKTFPGATEADGVFYDIPETPIDQAPGFIKALTEQVETMQTWLNTVEWIRFKGEDFNRCPLCRRPKKEGHDPQCNWIENRAALGEVNDA